jgi:hypothetical protein
MRWLLVKTIPGASFAPTPTRMTLAHQLRELETYLEENCPDEALLREISRLITDLEIGPRWDLHHC